MNHPTLDIPLLRKAVEWVETEAARPEGGAWNQGQWVFNITQYLDRHDDRTDAEAYLQQLGIATSCGTAYCVAGYIGQLLNPGYETTDHCMINGEDTHVSDFAQVALGLTMNERDRLFDGDNDAAETVRKVAESIAARAGERL